MKPLQRISKKTGEVSYLLRINLDYKDGQQITKSKTWKPERKMTPKQIESELIRQQVLFEEKAKQDYAEELKREADKKAEQERIEAEEREKQYNALEYKKRHTTFKELADKWLDIQSKGNKYKPSTIVKLNGCKQRTYEAIGDVLVSQLDYLTIQEFIFSLANNGVNQKTGKGLGIKSQKSYLIFISDVMKFAKRCKLVTDNPCREITFTKTDTKEKMIYSLQEAKDLLATIEKKAPIGYKVLFTLLAYCGMRKGEALGLEYKDIDFENNIMQIRRTSNYQQGYGVYTDTPKTDSSNRSLHLQPKLIEMIKQLKAEQKEQAIKCGDQWVVSDRLFTNWCGKPLHPNNPYKWLKRFCEKESESFKGLHSFRHFVATQALANGAATKDVSDLLGHANPSVTLNVYAHTVEPTNEKTLNMVANLLDDN